MGGSNQSTCTPPPQSAKSVKGARAAVPLAASGNPVRYHEVTSRGEVDFHDDKAGVKCAVNSAAFFSAYNPWRSKMSEDLVLAGDDGSGGRASVTFMPYVDNLGEMQVAMTVKKATMGHSVLDLDKLAHYS